MSYQFAIEMEQDAPGRCNRYGVVHAADCSDLIDPETVGTDWRAGVSDLGTDWELDVADGAVRLAPCAKKLERDSK